MGNLSTELRSMARGAGLCNKWFGEWKDNTETDILFDMYKRGIDFSISHDWISNDFIKRNWSKEVLQRNNIFVDDINISCESPKGTIIINGDSNILISFSDYDAADVYVRHNSKVHFTINSHARIMINVYDNASIVLDNSDSAIVSVFNHSNPSNVKDIGSIKSNITQY